MRKALLAAIPRHLGWVPSLLNVSDRFLEKLARRNDHLVRGNEVLIRAVLDRSLACGSEGVVSLKPMTHPREGFGFHGFAILHIPIGAVSGQSVLWGEFGAFPCENAFIKRRARTVDKGILPVVHIIDGNVPVNRIPVSPG